MFAIGQEVGSAVNVTLPRITLTSPALLSAEGDLVLRASAVSNPSGYGEVIEFYKQAFGFDGSLMMVILIGKGEA